MDLSKLSQFPIACAIVPDEGKLKLWSEQLSFVVRTAIFQNEFGSYWVLNPIGVWQDIKKKRIVLALDR